ncbi:MAG TPA: FixH family protein [Aggregatilineales bacterium]|nr:FixH family protein [Aggregatilineales bacterium]
MSACAGAASPTITPSKVDLSVRAEPEPPAVGDSELIVTLKDAQGTPIDGMLIQAHGNMDHAGMAPVDGESHESLKGVYRIPFEWTMGGGWFVTITATLPDGSKISRDFSFTVEAVSSESIIRRATGTPASDFSALNIAYSPDRSPALVGSGIVIITVTGPDGAPVTNAMVKVTGNMLHEGMMPITGEGKHMGEGQYQVSLQWSMAGDWQVVVNVTRPDGTHAERTFDQDVVMP